MECKFCDFYEGRQNIFYENNSWFARLDRHPVTAGHFNLIPVRHVESLFNLNPIELSDMGGSIEEAIEEVLGLNLEESYKKILEDAPFFAQKFIERVIKDPWFGERPTGYNIGMNEGSFPGENISHINFHIILRYEGDSQDYSGGVRNVIPGRGNYRKWTGPI